MGRTALRVYRVALKRSIGATIRDSIRVLSYRDLKNWSRAAAEPFFGVEGLGFKGIRVFRV